MLSLEAVLVLPILALLVVGLLQAAVVIRDVLLVHEAARIGARVAATSDGTTVVVDAVRAAVPELAMTVTVTPERRRNGELVTVSVAAERPIGPVTRMLRARAVALVEPVVRTDAWSVPP